MQSNFGQYTAVEKKVKKLTDQNSAENVTGHSDPQHSGESRCYNISKRVIDIAVAGTVWALTLPIQAVVALAILVDLGRPVLFVQPRPGLRGDVFQLVKFRTMRVAEGTSSPDDDADRLTALGRLLRATSVDELPTLLNVIKGDMSLVGPRPLLVAYLPMYTDEEARRHEVRPGITGLAQVKGRNRLTWEEKFELDIEYVNRRSMRLDLQILLATVGAVIKREGISAPGASTMPQFFRPPRQGS